MTPFIPRARRDLDRTELDKMSAGECPLCSYLGFRLGPRGGASQNIECMGCHSIFNVVTYSWEVVAGEKIKIMQGEREVEG